MPIQEIDVAQWFESEIKPHEPALKGYLFKRVPEPADVDDVVQETYRRILEVAREKPIQSARGLLFAIARNASRDLFRSPTTSRTISVPEIERFPVVDSAHEPSEALKQLDDVMILREAISRLPARCRQVLILRNFEHLTYKEIADRMKISTGTVETQLKRALKKCQKYFLSQGLL